MTKPPLIRSVKAKPPATLEIAWRTGDKLTVDITRLIKRFKLSHAPLSQRGPVRQGQGGPLGPRR